MERAAAEWRYDQLHEDAPFHDGTFANWSEKRTKDAPYHYRDGVNVWVAPTDLGLGGRFLAADGEVPSEPDQADEPDHDR